MDVLDETNVLNTYYDFWMESPRPSPLLRLTPPPPTHPPSLSLLPMIAQRVAVPVAPQPFL